ncbi:hypothetical protein LWI29_013218 [Acer saccharum]|uniref:DUF1985 domain-containing protein n=1 Tax=Acer saccharum TaxID=4024 RepID=A0AA39VPW8_ACESA|nr:hypothetical protein LWI29_013218 [Acer saccharum]
MALDPNTRTFLYPDNEGWINARIHSKSRQHCNILVDIDKVLGRLHVLEVFKQGPFGHYLGLHLPVTIHGKVLHSILKRQIEYTSRSDNASPPRDDEMWFGLGRQQHRFGQVEFCLCSGLKMGKFPEGLIRAKYTPTENSLYVRHFQNQPTYDSLFQTFKRLTVDQGEDGLKMANLLVIGYILCTLDTHDCVLLWMFTLVDDDVAFEGFPWGSYVYSYTLNRLKNVIHKNVDKLRPKLSNEADKNESYSKTIESGVEGEGKQESQDAGPSIGNAKRRRIKKTENKPEADKNESYSKIIETGVEGEGKQESQNAGPSKRNAKKRIIKTTESKLKPKPSITYNLSGFLLSFQVWAVERFPCLTGVIGIRRDQSYPRFKNWEFLNASNGFDEFFFDRCNLLGFKDASCLTLYPLQNCLRDTFLGLCAGPPAPVDQRRSPAQIAQWCAAGRALVWTSADRPVWRRWTGAGGSA